MELIAQFLSIKFLPSGETAKWEKITYLGIATCTVLAVVNLSKPHPHHDPPPVRFLLYYCGWLQLLWVLFYWYSFGVISCLSVNYFSYSSFHKCVCSHMNICTFVRRSFPGVSTVSIYLCLHFQISLDFLTCFYVILLSFSVAFGNLILIFRVGWTWVLYLFQDLD